MDGYYGFREGTAFVYFPYYFVGMSLNGTSFKFRFDFPFLDRLAKSRLCLEDLTKKRRWEIEQVDIPINFLECLLSYVHNNNFEKAKEEAYEIMEMTEGKAFANKRNQGYDDGYFDLDSPEEFLEDRWWDLGLEPPFLRDDIDWNQD